MRIAGRRRLPATLPAPPEGTGAISLKSHRFKAGDMVELSQPTGMMKQAGLYHIVRPMPLEGSTILYRVRSAVDQHERVISETYLTAANRSAS